MNWEQANRNLDERRQKALLGGGQSKIDKQHAGGKLTARERLELLFDQGSFVETDAFIESRIDDFDLDKRRVPGDGVVTGYGYVDGRLVFAASEDFTVIGGTLGEYHSMKICRLQDMAMEMKAPLVCVNDSGGARIEEGISSLSGYAGMFLRHTKASGVIPQIAVILGPCSGGACYAPAICDFIFMVRETSKMFITGPNVVKTVINEETTVEELGGAQVHARKSGVSHFTYDTEGECLMGVRKLLNYLPSNFEEKAPVIRPEEKRALAKNVNKVLEHVGHLGRRIHSGKKGTENPCAGLEEIVPDNSRRSYDVKEVIACVADRNSFFEVQQEFAPNAVVGFARMEGETVGFVANQPAVMGGSLDYHASDKIARFIRFCDCFGLPILTLVDVPEDVMDLAVLYLRIYFVGMPCIMVYNFGAAALKNAKVRWSLTDAAGKTLAKGNLKPLTAGTGDVFPAGEFSIPLGKVRGPQKLTVHLNVGETIGNSWNIWVYPRNPSLMQSDAEVLYTTEFGEQAKQYLAAGKKVVL